MAIVRGLCTLAEARAAIFKASEAAAPVARNTEIEDFVSAATPVIEKLTGPMYAESRTVIFDGGHPCVILPFRFNAVTSITVNGVAWTDYTAEGSHGIIWGGSSLMPISFYAGTQNVTVVVTVGYATIPPNVKKAALALVTHWWQQGEQGNRPAFGDTSNDPAIAFGVPTRRLAELLGGSEAVPGFA